MIRKLIIVVLVSILFTPICRALGVTLTPGNINSQLNNVSPNPKLVDSDSIVLDFSTSGVYLINRTIIFNTPKVRLTGVKGAIIKLSSAFQKADDCVFEFKNEPQNKIEVEIRNLEFKSNYVLSNETHFFKIHDADNVLIEGIKMTVENAKINCIDVRKGKDIMIRDNEFYSFTRSKSGGVLWLRGNMENVTISNNMIQKWGNDEAIAFWSSTSDDEDDTIVTRRNILISGNTIIYKPEKGTASNDTNVDHSNDSLIKIFNYSDSEPVSNIKPCHYENISVDSNTIISHGNTRRIIGFWFDKVLSTGRNLSVTNNSISCSNYSYDGPEMFHRTFSVFSREENEIEVDIENNVVDYNCSYTSYGYSSLSCIEVQGGTINFNHNKVTSKNEYTLIFSDDGSSSVRMTGNEVSDMGYLAQVTGNSNNNIGSFDIYACDNIFSGKTWLYSKYMLKMSANFMSNVMNSVGNNLLFIGMAQDSNIIFNGNTVNANPSMSNVTLYESRPTAGFASGIESFIAINNKFTNVSEAVFESIRSISESEIIEENVFLSQ